MPAYNVEYRPEVYSEDFRKIPRNLQNRILRAIEKRLMTKPTAYGVRLSQALTGLWKMRVGDYRIVAGRIPAPRRAGGRFRRDW